MIDISSCNGNFDYSVSNKLTSSQELSKYDESDMVRIEVYSSSNDANAKLTVGKNRDTLLKDNDFDEY